ncbi:hypothetical protein AVEN_90477-1 [Araneus ventricosus]|uniref:Uncharacterized protein n=1 Tax=Araneus ventricosus TaxID=182803 RepID=A0A4Y2SDC3_ARAVE|nr:hypothetical protein AVEN_90477-1 [Araneus ventricosus]
MEIRLTARTAISFFKTELIDGSGLRASVSAEKWATSLDAKVRIHDLRRNRDSDQISRFLSFSPIRRVRVAMRPVYTTQSRINICPVFSILAALTFYSTSLHI